MKKLLAILSVVLFANQVGADDIDDYISGVPDANRASVKKVISKYVNDCKNMGGDLGIKINDNFIQEELLQGPTKINVVVANFGCSGAGYPWSGSGGSPTYYIIGEQIFEGPRAWPRFLHLNENKKTIIVGWHGGSSCQTVSSEPYANAAPCFSAFYWNHFLQTFAVFDGQLDLIEVDFDK